MNEQLRNNNHDKVYVWTIAEYEIAQQYLIERKPSYDKMKNKQKMFIYCTFLPRTSSEKNLSHIFHPSKIY